MLSTRFIVFFCLVFISGFSEDSHARKNNLQLIQEDVESGFAIYRTSRPDARHMREFCKLGIEEMVVLSGNAEDWEFKYQEHCPNLKVVYNKRQRARVAITSDFLEFFDNWVKEAKAKGKKIAFRCNCGCHRTGRLAAYYQMKYQGLTVKDAQIIMKKHGKWMFLFRSLWPQVAAMNDYIYGRECSTRRKFCVKEAKEDHVLSVFDPNELDQDDLESFIQ